MERRKRAHRTVLYAAAVLLCLMLTACGFARNRRTAHYRPIAAAVASYEHVFVLGSAAAARELLRDRAIEDVDFVTPERQFARTANTHLHHYTEGPFHFLEKREKHYDFTLITPAAPKTEAESRVYTNLFYRMCTSHLNEDGALTIETVSPNAFSATYQCFALTMESERLSVQKFSLSERGNDENGVLFATLEADISVLPADTPLHCIKEPTGTEIPLVDVNRLNRPLLPGYLEEEEKTK